MNTLTRFLIALTIFITLHTTLSSTTSKENLFDIRATEGATLGFGRFLADTGGLIKCDMNPRLCHAKGSPRPDCCNRKCVNVDNDKQNCGLCGKKCKYMEICCKGSCVNPMVNKRHCGGCNYVCTKGDACVHGMCGYA